MNTDNKNTETEQCAIPSVSGSFIFDKDLIKKAMTAEKPYYAMGVDTYVMDYQNQYIMKQIRGPTTSILPQFKN